MKKLILGLIATFILSATSLLAQDAWIVYYQASDSNGNPEGTRSIRFASQEEMVTFLTVTVPSMAGAEAYTDANGNLIGIHGVTFQSFVLTSDPDTVIQGDWIPVLIDGTDGYLVIWTEDGVEKSEVLDKVAAEAKRLEIFETAGWEMVYDEAMFTQRYSLNKEPDTIIPGDKSFEIIAP